MAAHSKQTAKWSSGAERGPFLVVSIHIFKTVKFLGFVMKTYRVVVEDL